MVGLITKEWLRPVRVINSSELMHAMTVSDVVVLHSVSLVRRRCECVLMCVVLVVSMCVLFVVELLYLRLSCRVLLLWTLSVRRAITHLVMSPNFVATRWPCTAVGHG